METNVELETILSTINDALKNRASRLLLDLQQEQDSKKYDLLYKKRQDILGVADKMRKTSGLPEYNDIQEFGLSKKDKNVILQALYEREQKLCQCLTMGMEFLETQKEDKDMSGIYDNVCEKVIKDLEDISYAISKMTNVSLQH